MGRHLGLRAALSVVILLAVSLALAQDAQKDKKDEKAKDKAPDYYPIQPGNEWHYRHTAKDQISKVITRITKVEDFDGQKMSRLERPDSKDTEHLFQNEKGVFRARVNGNKVTPPLHLIPYPAKPGMKWQGVYTSQGEKGKYAGEIQKEEIIKVPAGEFKTIRVHIKLEGNGQQIETTFWFAGEVGFVKEAVDAAGVSILLELEKFERKK